MVLTRRLSTTAGEMNSANDLGSFESNQLLAARSVGYGRFFL